MDTRYGEARELWGQKFKIVKNGLDEAEVFSFIGGLIDQNNNLASKLEHLDSLTKFAEKTIIEANKEANSIKTEAEEKATSSVKSIIAEATEKARKETERVISEGELKAKQSEQEIIAAAEQQAQEMLKSADGKAESIRKNAEMKANDIIAEAKDKAEDLANARTTRAKKEAQSIVEAAKAKAEEEAHLIRQKAERESQSIVEAVKANAEEEAHLIRQKAEQLLRISRNMAEDEIKDKLKKVHQSLLSSLEETDKDSIILPTVAHKESKPAKSEPVVYLKAETETKESQRQISLSEAKPEVEDGSDIYEGKVELIIPPPLELDQMLQLHKHLRNIPNLEVLYFGISANKSITISISLDNPTPIRKFLEDLPEVDTTEDTPQDSEMTLLPRKGGDRTPVKRIIVNIKK